MKHASFYLSILSFFFALTAAAETYSVKSPDGKIEAAVSDGLNLRISVMADGRVLLKNAVLGMDTDKGGLGSDCKASKAVVSKHSEMSPNPFGLSGSVLGEYGRLELDFGQWKLEVRVYDEAVAYRFSADFGAGQMLVESETLRMPLSESDALVAHVVRGFNSGHEENFLRTTVGEMDKFHSASMPLIISREGGYKLALVESDCSDYPLMHAGRSVTGLEARFTKCPKALKLPKGTFVIVPDGEEPFIARTAASRNFPWRAFIVARKDSDLAYNNTVFKLASPSQIADVSWVGAGTSAWDWWVNWNSEDLGFPADFSDEMCRYYVDFAAENGIACVTLDAGWHIGRRDASSSEPLSDYRARYYDDSNFLDASPHVNIPEIVKYAHGKGVKVFLWAFSKTFYYHPERFLDRLKNWNVDGLKIDFTNRNDQLAVRHFENISRLAAERKIMVDWHGCPAVPGLNRKYPNIVNFEGVLGAEFNKFAIKPPLSPSHDVDLVFTRMLLGPMDYTPGGMRNVKAEIFKPNNEWPQVLGTRAHMASMYVLFFAPLQMMSDAPSEYRKYPEILNFLSECPTTWDESKALDGEIGKYVVVARRKGDVWYVGGMCDWDGKEYELDFSRFLPAGEYDAFVIRDSVNSNRIPQDSVRETLKISSSGKMKISMKKGGGFAIKIVPRKVLGIF